LAYDRDWDDKDGYDSEADASFALAASLRRLQGIVNTIEGAANSRIERLTSNANRCRAKYEALINEDEEGEHSAMGEEHRLRSSEPFDVSAVFADL
jgi:hypothetical protein